jgi:hypothetical protein
MFKFVFKKGSKNKTNKNLWKTNKKQFFVKNEQKMWKTERKERIKVFNLKIFIFF